MHQCNSPYISGMLVFVPQLLQSSLNSGSIALPSIRINKTLHSIYFQGMYRGLVHLNRRDYASLASCRLLMNCLSILKKLESQGLPFSSDCYISLASCDSRPSRRYLMNRGLGWMIG